MVKCLWHLFIEPSGIYSHTQRNTCAGHVCANPYYHQTCVTGVRFIGTAMLFNIILHNIFKINNNLLEKTVDRLRYFWELFLNKAIVFAQYLTTVTNGSERAWHTILNCIIVAYLDIKYQIFDSESSFSWFALKASSFMFIINLCLV